MPEKKVKLPLQGISPEELLKTMEQLRQHDAQWQAGRTWSLVYHAGDAHTEFLKAAYNLFFAENGLNPAAFPSLKKFEAEVISMTAHLLGGDEQVAGSMTSGGTESVLMAVKTYRDWARATRPQIQIPEMILPITAHPAFEKAAHYFSVRAVHVPLTADFRADLQAVREAINENTILLVGSAPGYPQGVIDPIAELASLALARGLGFHVDACLGGFLLPFVKKLGYPLPDFDFRIPGVTSMSADLHKYGFAAKGASTILYRHKDLWRYQFFIYTDWPGGISASPTMTGTRPGGAIAAAWAALKALGEDGYLRYAGQIMQTTQSLIEGIAHLPGLYILGQPAMSVFAFGSDEVNIFAVADCLEARGWNMDRQQKPHALHLMVTPVHRQIVQPFLADLRAAVEYVRAHPSAADQGKAPMYGMIASLPDRSQVRDFVLQFMENLYDID